jgi:protein SCO1/2
VGFDQRLGGKLPLDLVFRDETGRSVRLGDYFGRRPVVLSLVYYECPMLCGLTLSGLARALQGVSLAPGTDFEAVTVSFDPRESPELAAAKKTTLLARYDRPGLAPAWHFLTGDPGSVTALTDAVGFRYAWDEETRQFAHPAGAVVLTRDGTVARYLFGIEPASLDLRLALAEAGEGRVGSVVEQALLYCYRYDPATGSYAAEAMRVLRLAAAFTVLALVGAVALMLGHERRAATRRSRATSGPAAQGRAS